MSINFTCFSLFLLLTVNFSVNCEKNDSVFVPSTNWRPVKKGQPIPSGLHVRHNFETGQTEAKLLDEKSKDDSKDGQAKSLTLHPDKSVRHSEEDATASSSEKNYADDMKISLEELKARLKKIKMLANGPQRMMDEQSNTEAQNRFKSYEELKKELKLLEMNITTDSEMLKQFFERFEKYRDHLTSGSLVNSAINDIVEILNSMADLLHQIDNAQLFADMGGMTRIISPCLNATNEKIKVEALKVLGTAVQSNKKVQAKALENDLVQKLLHILSTKKKVDIQLRCLFALSCLIRQYPPAQKAFLDYGGLDILVKILQSGYPQSRSRVMSLISDLVIERRDVDLIEDDALRVLKIHEYGATEFEKKLSLNDYCKHLSNLMVSSFGNEDFGDYDFLTAIVESMLSMRTVCKNDFASAKSTLIGITDDALRHYQGITDFSSEVDDYAISNLVSLLILLQARLKQLEISHDEL